MKNADKRLSFVEAVLAVVEVLDFTLPVARVHARVTAELAAQGRPIGAHDLIIATTALYHKLSLLTDNVDEFRRIPGLDVIAYTT